jgi:hypothetical protein
MIAGQSAFCILSTIPIKHPHLELQMNQRLVTAIAIEDQDRLHPHIMQCSLQPIARER